MTPTPPSQPTPPDRPPVSNDRGDDSSTVDLPLVPPTPVGDATADCPGFIALESIAAGGERSSTLPRQVITHVAGCHRCRTIVDEILENNRFLAGVGQDLTDSSATALLFEEREAEPPVAADEVPGYRIEGPIKRGAQGVVYKATQLRTGRDVAIKMLAWGASVRQRSRLEREAEIAAGLKHPNIVTVYDAMVLPAGRVAIAMEYVEGVPLDEAPGGKRERLSMFVAVCEAVHYAHQRGVIHRDLKPANILVDRKGQPRVLDFGIAKRNETAAAGVAAAVTVSGEFSGTLAYASPEQVRAEPGSVTASSDVYSLGVILCELVTGLFPYSVEGSVFQVAKNVMEAAPVVPADWRSECGAGPLDTDLRTIILHALDKDPTRRYASAADLAADVSHYLTGEAISARRDSTWYVLRKLARKHRVAVAAAASMLAVVVGSAISLAVMYRDASNARDTERAARRQLAAEAVARNLSQARLLSSQHEAPPAEDLAWQEWAAAMREDRSQDAERAIWALRQIYRENPCLVTTKFASPIISLGRWTDRAGAEGVIVGLEREIHHLTSDLTQAAKRALDSHVGSLVTISIGGATAISATLEGQLWLTPLGSQSSEPIKVATIPGFTAVAVSEDGSLIAVADKDRMIRVLRPDGTEVVALSGHVEAVRGMSFSHDAKRLATIEGSSMVRSWGLPEGASEVFAVSARTKTTDGTVHRAAVESGGVVYSIVGPTVTKFRAGELPMGFSPRPMGSAFAATLSPDERLLALGTDSACTVPLWKTTGQLAHSLSGHRDRVDAILFSSGGDRLYSGSRDGVVKAWRHESREVPGLLKEMTSVAVQADGTTYLGGVSGCLVRLDPGRRGPSLVAGKLIPELEARPSLVAASKSGVVASVTMGTQDQPAVLSVWRSADREPVIHEMRLDSPPISWVVETDGTWGLLVQASGKADLLDLATGAMTPVSEAEPVIGAACGGDTVFAMTPTRVLRVFHPHPVGSGQTHPLFTSKGPRLAAIASGEHGRYIVVGATDGSSSLIDVSRGEATASVAVRSTMRCGAVSESAGLFAVCNGPQVFVYSFDGEVRATVERPELSIVSLAFTPDGRSFVGCGAYFTLGFAGVWDLRSPDDSIRGNAMTVLPRLGEPQLIQKLNAPRTSPHDEATPGVIGRSFTAPVSSVGRE